MADAKNLTPDEEALSEQLEMMTELRHKGWIIDRLEKAPVHVAGVDDHTNRFAWYSWTNPQGDLEGYTHMPKEVDF